MTGRASWGEFEYRLADLRGVSASDISDALNNPISVTAGSSPYSWKYWGARAEVVLNLFGRVITLWPR